MAPAAGDTTLTAGGLRSAGAAVVAGVAAAAGPAAVADAAVLVGAVTVAGAKGLASWSAAGPVAPAGAGVAVARTDAETGEQAASNKHRPTIANAEITFGGQFLGLPCLVFMMTFLTITEKPHQRAGSGRYYEGVFSTPSRFYLPLH